MNSLLVSTYLVCERISVMHKQVSGWTVNFVQILQKAPFWNFRPESPSPPPQNKKLQIWDDQSLLRNTPPNEKLQIWDDQSLLWNTPPMKNFRFEMTKVYSGIPPNEKLQIWDDQTLLRNTRYPPWIPLVNMVFSRIY